MKNMRSNPEVPVGKGMARTGFETTFKLPGLAQISKGNIEPEFPGLEAGCVLAFAGIMLFYTFLDVGSMADISLI